MKWTSVESTDTVHEDETFKILNIVETLQYVKNHKICDMFRGESLDSNDLL